MEIKDLAHIKYKRGLFSVNDYFLTNEAKLGADINYCIQCSENITGALNDFYTLLIDLNQPLESIKKDIYHRTFSEINSFISNQDFEHKIISNLSNKDVDFFIELFDTFAKAKKIRKAEAYRLKAYNNEGILAISYIKQNNNFLCVNFYRLTKARAGNISSFLNQKKTEEFNATHLGRAHRTLHWLDIVEFKNAGVKYYDFCGWYEGNVDKNLLNINKFKEQFTKNKVKEYTGVIYKNKLLIFLLKLFK